MRTITLAAVAAGFLCSTMAIAAPIPASVSGIGMAGAGDIVQVRKRKKFKTMRTMKRNSDMGGGGGAGAAGGSAGGGMQGGSQGGASGGR